MDHISQKWKQNPTLSESCIFSTDNILLGIHQFDFLVKFSFIWQSGFIENEKVKYYQER